MADAIWADIAAQLDGDLPQDSETPAPDNTPAGGITWATGIKLAIGTAGIALVAYWLTRSNPMTPNLAPVSPAPTEQRAPLGDTAQQAQPAPYTKPSTTAMPMVKDLPANSQGSSPIGNLQPMATDSLHLQPTAGLNVQPDSTVAPVNRPSLVLPSPTKKKRGTQGIQDSDYKFVRDKDST